VALPPAASEYRLVLTNSSGQVVALSVDGQEVGVFCPKLRRLEVGNFPISECSRIKVSFFDLDRHKDLDDCGVYGAPYCLENNRDGAVCFDTMQNIRKVYAEIK